MSKRIVVKLPASLVVFLRMIEMLWGLETVRFNVAKLKRQPQLDKETGKQKLDKRTNKPLWKPNRFRIRYTYPLPTKDGKAIVKTVEGTTKEVKDKLDYLVPDQSVLMLDRIMRMEAGLAFMKRAIVSKATKLAELKATLDASLEANPDTSLAELEKTLKGLYDSIGATPAPDMSDDANGDSESEAEAEFAFETQEAEHEEEPEADEVEAEQTTIAEPNGFKLVKKAQ